MKPWHHIFDHATPEQLACFGVQPPGHPFWNETTLARAQRTLSQLGSRTLSESFGVELPHDRLGP